MHISAYTDKTKMAEWDDTDDKSMLMSVLKRKDLWMQFWLKLNINDCRFNITYLVIFIVNQNKQEFLSVKAEKSKKINDLFDHPSITSFTFDKM